MNITLKNNATRRIYVDIGTRNLKIHYEIHWSLPKSVKKTNRPKMLYISVGILRRRGGGEIICILAKSITHFKCTTSKRSYQLCFLLCFSCPVLSHSMFSLFYFTNCLYVCFNIFFCVCFPFFIVFFSL